MATVVTGYVPKPEGDAALLAGIEEARRRDARLVVVHAKTDQDAEPAYLGEVRGLLADSGVDHELRVLESGHDASDQLVDLAEELAADLIVIGLRRRSPVGKLILGSNAQRVLLDAPCPVLTVKPRHGAALSATDPGPLVDADELAGLLGTVTLLDVRYRMAGGPWGPEEYAAGHLPGASYVDLDTALAAPAGCRWTAPVAGDRGLRGGHARRRRLRRPAGGRLRRLGRPGRRALLVAAALPRPPGRAGARRRLVGLDGGRAARRDRFRRSGGPGHLLRGARRPAGRDGGRRALGRRRRRRPRGRALPRRDRADRPGGRPDPRRGQRADGAEPHRRRPVPARRRAP